MRKPNLHPKIRNDQVGVIVISTVQDILWSGVASKMTNYYGGNVDQLQITMDDIMLVKILHAG